MTWPLRRRFLLVSLAASVTAGGCSLGHREHVAHDGGASRGDAGRDPLPSDASQLLPGADGAASDPDAGMRPPDGADSSTPTVDSASPPPPPPLGDLHCRVLTAERTESDPSWGAALTDIVHHLPRSYGDAYYDADTVTWGHETSHGIHAHIRNYLNDTGDRANGFYVLDDRACLVREPMMRKSDVAPFIPASLRWWRYDLYITGSPDWDDTPLYVWDEWVAYTNGAEVGVDRNRRGLWTSGWRGTVDGAIEFTVYAIAVGMAAEAHEPGYFAREPNFRAFLAYNARRAVRLFREGRTLPDFAWDEQDAFFERFRTSADAADMRAWVRRMLGDSLAEEILAPLVH